MKKKTFFTIIVNEIKLMMRMQGGQLRFLSPGGLLEHQNLDWMVGGEDQLRFFSLGSLLCGLSETRNWSVLCHLVPALLGQRGSTGPVRPNRDQLLQTMEEICSAGGAQGRWRSSGEGRNFWAELNGRGGCFWEITGIVGRKWKCLKFDSFVVLYFCQCLIRSQSRKYLPNKCLR